MVRRLHKHVFRVAQCKQVATFETGNEIWHNMIVSTNEQLQFNSCFIDPRLQGLNALANCFTGIVIDAWQDVWCACDVGDALGLENPRHL